MNSREKWSYGPLRADRAKKHFF